MAGYAESAARKEGEMNVGAQLSSSLVSVSFGLRPWTHGMALPTLRLSTLLSYCSLERGQQTHSTQEDISLMP